MSSAVTCQSPTRARVLPGLLIFIFGVEHWRGFRSSPLGQNPLTANLGGRAQKGEERCQKEMIVRAVKATEDNSRVCPSFVATWRECVHQVHFQTMALQHIM